MPVLSLRGDGSTRAAPPPSTPSRRRPRRTGARPVRTHPGGSLPPPRSPTFPDRGSRSTNCTPLCPPVLLRSAQPSWPPPWLEVVDHIEPSQFRLLCLRLWRTYRSAILFRHGHQRNGVSMTISTPPRPLTTSATGTPATTADPDHDTRRLRGVRRTVGRARLRGDDGSRG